MATEHEKRIINFNAMNTLAELNKHFCNSKSMSKNKFMEIQRKVWKETKEAFGVEL